MVAAHQRYKDASGVQSSSSSSSSSSNDAGGGGTAHPQGEQTPPLLVRLRHLRRLTYRPSGMPGCGGPEAAELQRLVRACLDASDGGLVELRYDARDVVTASSRSAQQLRLCPSAVQSLVKAHPR